MTNPLLQERVFTDCWAEMIGDEDSVHFDLRATPADIMHTITEKWSNEQISAFAWSMLHHEHFDCRDTFVQFAHAMVKELRLPVDILELYNAHNVEEQTLAEASGSPYRKSSAQPSESNTGKSRKPPEPTVSMTWWDCPVCQASRGVPIVELPKVGVPHCSNCTQEMMQSSWARAHKDVEFRCPECDIRRNIPRVDIATGMICHNEDCEYEAPMELAAKL